MPIDTTTLVVSGFRGESTWYDLELATVEYDGGAVTATVDTSREGESAYVDSASVSLTINGGEVSTATENISSRSGSFTISGPASPGDSLSVEVVATNWDNESATLSGSVPRPEADPDLVSVDCSTSPERITLGETTTVAATISNDNDNAVAVDVTFELADASETLTVDVGGGETEQAEVTFEPVDTGEYTPEIEYDIV